MKALAFHFLYLRLMSVFQLKHVESNDEFTGCRTSSSGTYSAKAVCYIDFNIELN
jgi:hypothetical protein